MSLIVKQTLRAVIALICTRSSLRCEQVCRFGALADNIHVVGGRQRGILKWKRKLNPRG
jgi:hypothetical protein